MTEDTGAVQSNTETSTETAVAFISHTCHESILRRFQKLTSEVPPEYDVYFLYDSTEATQADTERVREVAGTQLRTFTRPEITTVSYPNPWTYPEKQELVPGNLDLLYLHFCRIEPDYSRYWFIEYDVVYTGPWTEFFQAFETSSADLMGSALEPYKNKQNWSWWQSLDPVPELDRSTWARGFFPVSCLSQELLNRLHEAYRAGWSGHFEAVIPTLARYHGLEIEDFGGDGPYVSAENRNRFYTEGPNTLLPGTFTDRPSLPRQGFRSGKLWHPIKPNQRYLLSYIRLFKRWIEVRLWDL